MIKESKNTDLVEIVSECDICINSDNLHKLSKLLTPTEKEACFTLFDLMEPDTNSLPGYNDRSTIPELMELTGLSKNIVKGFIAKLRDFGVIGHYENIDPRNTSHKFWVINPDICVKNRRVKAFVLKAIFNKI